MLAARIFKTVLAPALVLLPSPNPSVERDMTLDIDGLQRAECEYRGIVARFDELTRAYILQAYEDGQLLRWQAQPSPYNPETETLITAVFTAAGPKESAPVPELAHLRPQSRAGAGVTWRYSKLATVRVAPHGDLAHDAMAVFRATVDSFVERMVYAPGGGALRAGPDPSAPVLARIEAGAALLVEEERAGYVRVRQPPATAVGWLERKHVRAVEKTDGRDH
ncbi:MAG: hypothetical protein F4049_04310 [Gemmatimonadetes bacterium]|nr:hypothetical protein [Gemmatimonadota bacterium]MYK39423.1 hypothetical protein [Gemmatimonadota bacterium]